MSDDDRIFALADKRFPSLDALHAWFNAQLAGTKDEDEKVDLRLADQIATARHIRRAKAAADAPIPHPPAPNPPLEPLPPDASEDEQAARLYGPARIFGARQSQRAPGVPAKTLTPEEQAAEDEAARRLYGEPIGTSFGAVHSKEVDVKKANLPHARRQERAMKGKFEANAKPKDSPAKSESTSAQK